MCLRVNMNTDILTLPVYRLSREKYHKQREKYVNDNMYRGSTGHIKFQKEFHAKNPDIKHQFESHLINKFGGCWEFNEVIGFIKLQFLGTQVRGEYFEIKAKRITRTRKKIFEYITHKLAPELEIKRGANNQEIFGVVKDYVSDCYKELPEGRFIEDEQLKSIGPFINWRALLEYGT